MQRIHTVECLSTAALQSALQTYDVGTMLHFGVLINDVFWDFLRLMFRICFLKNAFHHQVHAHGKMQS